jgi:hypothetical protein
VTTACCLDLVFHSDNLKELWLVFITECEFDNTRIMVTPSIERRLVEGVCTHRSVKWCLNPLTPPILKLFLPALIKFSRSYKNINIRNINKTYKSIIRLVCFLIRKVVLKIIYFISLFIQFFQFHLSICNKNTSLLVQCNTY